MRNRSTHSAQLHATWYGVDLRAARSWAWIACAALASLLCAASAGAGGLAGMQVRRVVVVSSGDTPMLKTALAGIERSAGGIPVKTLDAENANAQAVYSAVVATSQDTALISVGNRASEFTERFTRVTPGSRVVHCLVDGDIAANLGSSVSVVPLAVPAEQYLAWLRVLLPKARRVGILFDATPNGERAKELAKVLEAAGFEPVLAPVTGPTSLPAALLLLAGVDALQTLPGPNVMAGATTRGLLLFSFRHRIPIIGPNVASVRAGALYALERNLEETGAYCASLALSRFVPLRASTSTTPREPRARVIVNLRTAERFELRWSPDVLGTLEPVAP